MSVPAASNIPAAPAAGPLATTEGSLIGRFVTVLSPLFAILAGFIAGWVATKVGVKLDQTQIASFMVVASTSALTATWKWLQGWQAHEQLVAQGKVEPRKQAPVRRKKAPASKAAAPAAEAAAHAVAA